MTGRPRGVLGAISRTIREDTGAPSETADVAAVIAGQVLAELVGDIYDRGHERMTSPAPDYRVIAEDLLTTVFRLSSSLRGDAAPT